MKIHFRGSTPARSRRRTTSSAGIPAQVWVPTVRPVASEVSAAARMTVRWTGASGSGKTAVLINPGRTSVPSMPLSHSAIHCSASASGAATSVSSGRNGSLYWPVLVMNRIPVRRPSSRSTSTSRARYIGLQSTNVRTPSAYTSATYGSISATTSSRR